MYALVYNNKAFKIQDKYTISNSNNEVKFSDVTIDFTGKTIEDIPFKYQKMEIRRSENEADILNGEIIFVGYLDEIKLPDMKMKDEYRTLELTLLSPLKMATVRTVSIIGTFKTEEAIKRALQPLLDDGFIIKEMDDFEGQISLNFIMETVENCMNNICSKKNIFWFINEKREIFIRSIDLMLTRPSVLTIDENVNLRELGLDEFEPEIENVDYANIINIKNIRLKYNSRTKEVWEEDSDKPIVKYSSYPVIKGSKIIKKGDTINFDNPIIVDESTLKETLQWLLTNEDNFSGVSEPFYAFYFNVDYYNHSIPSDFWDRDFDVYIDNRDSTSETYMKYIVGKDVSFSDDEGEEKIIVLQRDQTFKNLITGFKYNGEDELQIFGIDSETALRKTNLRFTHQSEIEKLKGIISDSGQIEKTVDFNEKWTTWQELSEYAKNLIIQNMNLINEVALHFTKNIDLKIGDIIEVKMSNYYTEGFFAVTEVEKIYKNDDDIEMNVIIRNSNFVSTYIDMFRPEEKEEDESQINSVVIGTYINDNIQETHSIIEAGDNNENQK